MTTTGQQSNIDQEWSQSEAEQRVQGYMLDNEEISYSLRLRPTGFVNFIKSWTGLGVTYWFITNRRLIETTRVGGGFTFKDSPHAKISSVEYGSKVSLPVIAIGALIACIGLLSTIGSPVLGIAIILIGIFIIWYGFFKRRQVLAVKAAGSVEFSYGVSKGQQVDEFVWYLHAERSKHMDRPQYV